MYAAEQNRREFLQYSALGLAGLALPSASRPEGGRPARGPGQQAAASRYLLTLDGVTAGFLRSVEGGSIYADVITEAPDSSGVAEKHLGPVKYEPFTMQFDFSLGGPLFDWIAASWRKDQRSRNGVVVAIDYRGQAISQREFVDARLVEVTIPAMDAASKDPAFFTIKVQPESIRSQNASGAVSASSGKTSRPWFASGFRFEIDGFDATGVSRIESFTVKQAHAAMEGVGGVADTTKEPATLPTTLEVPNLAVQLSPMSAAKWVKWHSDFVIKGDNAANREKTGRLVLLSQDMRTELAEVRFFGLGIYALREVAGSSEGTASAARNSSVAQLRAELYCERMEFSYNAAVVG